jgi:hypothetical protein
MTLCPFKKFKNALGVPGKGIHRFRLMNTAIFDYILTIIMAILSSYLLKVPLVLSTIAWFILGIVAHMLFDVKTNTIKTLGLSC